MKQLKKMKKILVIEDNNCIRETLLEILESRGFEAVGARNGQVGIQLAVAQIPDVILSDVMMPELNGFEVFAAVRSHPATASIRLSPQTLQRQGNARGDRTSTRKINSWRRQISQNTGKFCQTESKLARLRSNTSL
jgi:CheY-like chemotaxis protein